MREIWFGCLAILGLTVLFVFMFLMDFDHRNRLDWATVMASLVLAAALVIGTQISDKLSDLRERAAEAEAAVVATKAAVVLINLNALSAITELRNHVSQVGSEAEAMWKAALEEEATGPPPGLPELRDEPGATVESAGAAALPALHSEAWRIGSLIPRLITLDDECVSLMWEWQQPDSLDADLSPSESIHGAGPAHQLCDPETGELFTSVSRGQINWNLASYLEAGLLIAFHGRWIPLKDHPNLRSRRALRLMWD